MTRPDHEHVRDALDHLTVLRRHLTRTDLSDETVADAVGLRLAAAIEAIAATTPEYRTVDQDLPEFERVLRSSLRE